MDQEQQSRWRRIVRQVSWIIVVVLAVATALFVINHFFVHRPLWDWLQLLIVLAVLAGGGLWFNAQQREREQQMANERTQDEALQAYPDQMSDMLIPPSKDLPSLYEARPGDSLSSVARARTLTVLPRFDGERKGRVVQFLYESGLIAKRRLVLNLRGADMSKANLNGADLRETILLRARRNLRRARGEAERGLVFDADNLKVGEYLDRWLSDSVRDTVKATSFERYE